MAMERRKRAKYLTRAEDPMPAGPVAEKTRQRVERDLVADMPATREYNSS